ncbi:hypothetical protein Aduo_004683 [Ancylostoma duodenale]
MQRRSGPYESPKLKPFQSTGVRLGAVVPQVVSSAAPPSSSPATQETGSLLCPLPVIENGFRTVLVSPNPSSPYSTGDTLYYGCKFGYVKSTSLTKCMSGSWTPAPLCAVGQCSQPEYCYKNTTFHNSSRINTWSALTRANHDPPRYIFPTNPYRVCYTVDKSTYVWSDFNFNFQVLFCTASPLGYGYFEKQFYNTGEYGSIVCSKGFEIKSHPLCMNGN